jgi:hypothetical protein
MSQEKTWKSLCHHNSLNSFRCTYQRLGNQGFSIKKADKLIKIQTTMISKGQNLPMILCNFQLQWFTWFIVFDFS